MAEKATTAVKDGNYDKLPVRDDGKQWLTVLADWRIDQTGGRSYGICSVQVPKPFESASFKRGFPLTNPSHIRCATFSLLMSLEIVVSTRELRACEFTVSKARAVHEEAEKRAKANPSDSNVAIAEATENALAQEEDCVGKYFTVIMTRNKHLYEAVCGSDTDRVRRWAISDSCKPLDVFGYKRAFWLNMLSQYDWMVANGLGDLAYAPSDKDLESGNVLASHSVNLDLDPEKDYSRAMKNAPPELGEALMADMRRRNFLRQELVEATGARSSRGRRQLTKKEKAALLEKDKKLREKLIAASAATANKKNKEDGSAVNPNAAAAATAGTADIAIANTTTARGQQAADASGHVQDAEHGTSPGEQPAQDGAGEL